MSTDINDDDIACDDPTESNIDPVGHRTDVWAACSAVECGTFLCLLCDDEVLR